MFGVVKRGKGAQITIFVIVGILIIGAIATLLIFRSGIFKPAVSAEEAQKIVSAQVQPVRELVEGCMNEISIKLINTLGKQGGYILPKAERFSFPSSVMASAPPMPYALFDDINRGYLNLFPPLNEMKAEFVQTMENNPEFDACIGGFSSFKGIVDVRKTANMKIDAANLDFGERSGNIVIPFGYPLEISKGNAKTNLDNYQIVIPIDLSKIHETTTTIINAETGNVSITQILQEQALLQEQRLRTNSRSDTIVIHYTDYDSDNTPENGIAYDAQNTLYKIEYKNPGLNEPYYFYFLTGKK